MGKFFLTVFLLAALGVLAVKYGLPALREKDPETYRTFVGMFGGPTYDAPASDEPTDEVVETKPAKPVPAKPTPVKKAETMPPAVPAEIKREEPPPEPAEDPIVAAETAAAIASDPGFSWGVTLRTSPFHVFENNGLRKVGFVPAGTILEVANKRELPEGVAVSCKFLRKGKWTERFFVMMEADVVSFPGVTFSQADEGQRKTIVSFCSVLASYERMKNAERARLEAEKGNPHKRKYEPLKKDYDRLVEEIARLTTLERRTQFETVPGVSRGDLLAKLNKLRIDQKALEQKFFPVRDAFAEWEQTHVTEEIVVRPTPEMEAALARLRALAPSVSTLVPDLVPAELQ